MAENITLTKQELQELLLKQSAEQAKIIGSSLVDAMKELKKPTEEEQAKIDAQKAREKERRIAGVREAVTNGLLKAQEQLACPHSKPDGRHTFSGRVLNNGDASVACVRCQKEYRWQATNEQKSNGGALFLQDRDYPYASLGGSAMEGILAKWEKTLPPKQKAQRPIMEELLKEQARLEENLAKAV